MSTGDSVFDSQVDAAYQAVEGLLDTRISGLPWKKETYRQRAATWVNGLNFPENQLQLDGKENEVKVNPTYAQIEQVQAQVNQYTEEAKGNGVIRKFKKVWRWLFGESSDVVLKRYWLSYQENFLLMKVLHKTSDTDQRESAGKRLQTHFFEGMPNRWKQAFQRFKQLIPQYLNYLQSKEDTMQRSPCPAKIHAESKKYFPVSNSTSNTIKKIEVSKTKKEIITGHVPVKVLSEEKSTPLASPLPGYNTGKLGNHNQSSSLKVVTLKYDLGTSPSLKKCSPSEDEKKINTEEGRYDSLDLKNYIRSCGLLNLDPFEEVVTIEKARSNCRRLREVLHPDRLEVEKKKHGVEQNIFFYDVAIMDNNNNFNIVNQGLEYLENWFKDKKAPKLAKGSISSLDYKEYKKQHEEALDQHRGILNLLQRHREFINIGKWVNESNNLMLSRAEKRKQQVDKSELQKAEIEKKIAAERKLRIEKEEETGQEIAKTRQDIAETKEMVRKMLLFFKQGNLVVPAEASIPSTVVSEGRELSPVGSKVSLTADSLIKPTNSFDNSSPEEGNVTVGGVLNQASSARATRELYSDVFVGAGTGTQTVAKPEKDFSPSPV